MKIYVILYHWCDEDADGVEICGAFYDHDHGSAAMRAMAIEDRLRLIKDEECEMHSDFEQWGDDYISYGYYATVPFVGDCSWGWSLKPVEVQ